MKKHLIIGPMPPEEGGVTLLFKDLVVGLSDFERLKIYLVDINFYSSKFKIFKIIFSFVKILFFSFRSDSISFHLTARSLYIYGPVIIFLSFFGNKIIFRKFAGSFDLEYKKRGFFYKKIVELVLNRSSVSFLETRYLTDFFSKAFPKSNIYKFPNHRRLNFEIKREFVNVDNERKYLFLGAVNYSKGIGILIDIYGEKKIDFPTVDIYGYAEKEIVDKIKLTASLNYKGVIKNDEVLTVLREYDFLVFPTIHEGEGIPGVVIEAMSMGVPVISSKWRSVPEIVNQSNGFLFEPYDRKGLSDLLCYTFKLPDSDYELRSKNSVLSSMEYDSLFWIKFYYKFI